MYFDHDMNHFDHDRAKSIILTTKQPIIHPQIQPQTTLTLTIRHTTSHIPP